MWCATTSAPGADPSCKENTCGLQRILTLSGRYILGATDRRHGEVLSVIVRRLLLWRSSRQLMGRTPALALLVLR
jgi:hypothetical protein